MTTPEKMKVYLCYSRSDKKAVREVYSRLIADSELDVWLDEEKLQPSQNLELQIRMAIEDCDLALVFLSNESISGRSFYHKETRWILDICDSSPLDDVFAILVRLEDCTIPASLHKLSFVDFFNANGWDGLLYHINRKKSRFFNRQ